MRFATSFLRHVLDVRRDAPEVADRVADGRRAVAVELVRRAPVTDVAPAASARSYVASQSST